MENFVQKRIENAKGQKKAALSIANLVIPANLMMEEYRKLFSYFDLNDLKTLIESENKVEWIGKKWIQLNNIDPGKFSVDKLISLGLVQIPDYNPLLAKIDLFLKSWQANEVNVFILDIKEMYSIDEGQFVDPLIRMGDDFTVLERIDKLYVTETINEAENKYIETLEQLSGVFMTLINGFKAVSIQAVPLSLLSITFAENGYAIIQPHHQVLRDYRRRNANVTIEISEPVNIEVND
jgi:hypothetical protein